MNIIAELNATIRKVLQQHATETGAKVTGIAIDWDLTTADGVPLITGVSFNGPSDRRQVNR